MKQSRLLFLSVLLLLTPACFSQYGTLDSDFSDDGKVLTTFGEFHSSVQSIVIQPDGKIIAAGNMFDINKPFSQFALARYNNDGSLDQEFGFNGRIIENSDTQMHLHSMSLQMDDKILVAGIESAKNTSVSLLKRYNNEGTEDLSFGTAGKLVVNSIYSTSMAVQQDGKIILAGYSAKTLFKPSNSHLILIRFNKNGTLDEDFGFNGVVATSIRGLGPQISVAIQTDNKIVVAADTHGIDNSDIIILRYRSDGTLDSDFGTKGKSVLRTKNKNVAQAVKIHSVDGKILIGGNSLPLLSSSFILARLLPNGDVDPDFGDRGMAISADNTETLKSIAIQPDGMIIASGIYHNEKNSNDIILKRYQSDGNLDFTFGKNGVVLTAFDLRSGSSAVALQSDGKIVCGAEAGGSLKVDFALLRYISGLKVEEVFDDDKNIFSVSPNPVDKTVNLAFTLKHTQGLTVDLYDFNGRKIQNVLQRKDFSEGTHSYTIELPENLTKGIYFLNISNGKSISNLKIVK